MQLRPYQEKCIGQVFQSWNQYRKTLIVLPTGGGKTIIFANIASKATGRTLIIAHREELLQQAIDKIKTSTGLVADLERAESTSSINTKIVVGSIQTLIRRLDRFTMDDFQNVIVDESHHVAADSYQTVLGHFARSRILGVTATPDRSDKKQLGSFFETVAYEVTLMELIKDGYLSPIKVRVCDVSIDLSKVSFSAGDFDSNDTAHAIEPYLQRVAEQIKQYGGKKTLVFLPLIATSQKMTGICQSIGLNARHVDGGSEDRADILRWFKDQERAVLCNAMLLTEGYDEPTIDTIVCLRPTRSRALYTQIVGRGTRLADGKQNLLILDFLWMTGRHRLIRPTSLFADGEVAEIADKNTTTQGEFDPEAAADEARKERESKLAAELAKKKRFAGRLINPIEWGMATGDSSVVDYEATMKWHMEPVSEKQAALLASYGFDPRRFENKGQASALIDSLMARGRRELATPKQVKLLMQRGHRYAFKYSKQQASQYIAQLCKRPSSPATPASPALSPA